MDLLEDIFATPVGCEWQEQGSCVLAPEAFNDAGRLAEARAICRRCPVQAACLDYALEHDERFGLWGGLSPRERSRLARRPRPVSALQRLEE